MSMKICVFGAKGLLGEACVRLLGGEHQLKAWSRNEVDLRDLASLKECLSKQHFDVLINASGMTGLEQCLDHLNDAMQVNCEAPRVMADACRQRGAKMVHFSTDYVFAGDEPGWRSEDEDTRPVNYYGVTKLAGEKAVLESDPNALVCRVSWLFGHGRKSFVDQVVSASLAQQDQCYIQDKWSVPNFADDLVDWTRQLIERGVSGVVHLCSQGPEVTWLDYAEEVVSQLEQLNLLGERRFTLTGNGLDDVAAFRAKRPRYTSLLAERLERELGSDLKIWKDGLRRYLKARYLT